MKTAEILRLLMYFIRLSFRILIPIAIIFGVGYYLVYKKILKGTKRIKIKNILLCAVSICYIVIVIGATFLSRQPVETYKDTLNLNLFSSYVEAYHDIGVVLQNNILLRNLILNIMLFMPLGFLLPMYSDKLKKMYIVVPIGLLATLTIEFTQHFNDYGTFEIDDALNNTIGTLLGYCIFMIFYRLKNKENWKKIIGYAIPIIVTIGVFVGILVSHKNQEFGNFEFENNYTISMNNVDVKSEIDFSKERIKKEIYKTKISTKEESRLLAKNRLGILGRDIDDNEITEGENFILYRSTKSEQDTKNYWVNIDYVGARVTYNDSSDMIIKDGNIIFMNKVENATKEEVIQALLKLGIEVPEYAEFGQNRMEQYTFSVHMKKEGDKLIDGELRCHYYEDKTVKYVADEIITYDKIMQKEIMSEQEAYERILEGKFKVYTSEDIQSILVKNVQLEYKLDSKGYYVPIYKFDILLNEKNSYIEMKAIK